MRRAWAWLRALVAPGGVQRDIDDELAYHFAREVERNVAAGMPLADATFAARRRVGNVGVHGEQAREAVGARSVEYLAQDVRYALRTLRQAPAYTSVVVISLGLGIGASTAMFSVADGLLFKRLAVAAPDRLVTIEQRLADGRIQPNFGFSDYERFRTRTDIFAGMTATTWADGFNVVASGPRGGTDDHQDHISVVTGNFFAMLGVGATTGRLFSDQDDEGIGGHPVVVISDAYWARRFSRDRDVVGRTLTINATRFTIVGVAQAGFSGDWVGWPTDYWIPVAMLPDVVPGTKRTQRGGFMQFKLLGRLAPGATPAQAQASLSVVHRDIADAPVRGSGVDPTARLEVISAARGYSSQRATFATPVTILLVLVGGVLLIVCGNVANLSLARSTARQREIAVRLAIGASRARIARQLFTESIVVAIGGCGLGVFLAGAGMRVLETLIQSGPAFSVFLGSASLALDLHVDARVLAFAAAASTFTVLAFGLAPAVQVSRVSLTSVMNGRGAAAAASGMAARRALVALQVALSIVLLVAGSVFLRTLSNLRGEDIGAAHRSQLVMAWTLPGQIGARDDALRTLVSSVHDRLSRLNGVVGLTESGSGLLTGSNGGPRIWAEGRGGAGLVVDGSMTIGPAFFATVGQRLLAGREFDLRDTDTSAKVVIVDASLAHRLFGTASALGRRIATSPESGGTEYEIVGVVEDARYRNPRVAAGLMTYWPVLSSGRAPLVSFIARATGDAATTTVAVRRALREIAPTLPILSINTVDEQLDELLFRERLVADFAAFFAAVALVLASVGIFGLVAYVIARRTSEIAVRLALGAQRRTVLTLVIAESLRLVALGTLVGAPLAFVLHRAAARLTYGIPAADLGAIGSAIGALLAVAVCAALVPAARAASIDPATTLRSE